MRIQGVEIKGAGEITKVVSIRFDGTPADIQSIKDMLSTNVSIPQAAANECNLNGLQQAALSRIMSVLFEQL